ncbi:flagellin [Halobacillus litoralis]|uniref:flagellin N-terminal helical domain-containing protein n=1 Tax=Halobacillus litoralis TaxID=45668 RepID=UPI002490B0DB|nr:flagellin [Halobacillus litoralis]
MRINHNIAALNTHRQLGQANQANQNSMEKLSSGLRINNASDDAAGLAISEKMRGQIRGLEQAQTNAQDGISMIQTAEGALNETHDILQRMRELATQSANDTNTDSDRGEIQKEIEQLKSEVDRISNDTEFNTKTLLDGSIGQSASLGLNGAELDAVRAIDSNNEGTYTIKTASTAVGTENFISAGGVASGDVTINNTTGADGLESGSYTVEISGAVGSATATLFDKNGTEVSTVTGDSASDLVFNDGGSNALVTIAGGAYNGNEGSLEFDVNITSDITVERPDGTSETFSGVKADSNSVMSVDGLELDVASNLQDDATGTVVDVTNNGVNFHIGANEGQTTRLSINNMDTESLQIDDIDLRSQSGSESAITAINNAIEKVSGERSKLGATQNRLDHTINNLGTSSENLTAAESRIRDVDMAKEMMNQTKQSILSQASQAMLAKANQQPQGVLQLLR